MEKSDVEIRVRKANKSDEDVVIKMVTQLIKELRNTENTVVIRNINKTYQYIMEHEEDGRVFLAEDSSGKITGLITVAISYALHCGRYAIIEEFWVCDEMRDLGIGKLLLHAVENFCLEHSIQRIDVGLPDEDFIRYESTYQCYTHNGYVNVGMRKKKVLQ